MITDGTVIQGPPPISVAEAKVAGATVQPVFVITAQSSWGGPMLQMGSSNLNSTTQPLCSISAVGLNGKNQPNYDVIDAYATNSAVLNHSQLAFGNVGFNCEGAGADIDIEDSSIVQSGTNGIQSACPNMKIQRNVISGTAINGIQIGGSQVLINDNVIEQSGGSGVYCNGAIQVGIVGNYLDNNGKGTPQNKGGSNVRGNGCQALSISGNQFHRSDPYDEANESSPSTAQVHFDGANDGVSMAGNVYFVGNNSSAPQMRPDYILELGTSASITNFSFADSPTPQITITAPGAGVFGPNALAALGPFIPPTAQQNYFSGLSTSASGQTFSIQPGIAADSLGLQLLYLPSIVQNPVCTVNLGTSGLKGLDVPTVASNTQYNVFVVAQGGYASSASCIASASTSPNFAATLNDTTPAYYAQVFGYPVQGQLYIVNVAPCNSASVCSSFNPFGGISVGDTITDFTNPSSIPSNTTITALSSLNDTLSNVSVNSTMYVKLPPGWPNTYPLVGQMIGGGPGAAGVIPEYTQVSSVNLTSGMCGTLSYPCFVMTNAATTTGVVTLVASGAFTIQMSNNAQASSTYGSPDSIYVWNDRYRLVASLLTDANSNVTPYVRHGDTFYFNLPIPFTTTVGYISPTPITLAALPTVPVEAFGRCVASARVHIFNTGVSPEQPQNFPVTPGYDTQRLNQVNGVPNTSFPFRVYTDSQRRIYPQANGASATLDCMLDGWVLHRSS